MAAVIIDTELLVLLVVGSANRASIARHKRLGKYSADDFEILTGLIESSFTSIITLPQVLAEASNLASQVFPWETKRMVRLALRAFIGAAEEQHVGSARAAAHDDFPRLGLTDAAILVACASKPANTVLLATDGDLVDAARGAGRLVLTFDEIRAGTQPH